MQCKRQQQAMNYNSSALHTGLDQHSYLRRPRLVLGWWLFVCSSHRLIAHPILWINPLHSLRIDTHFIMQYLHTYCTDTCPLTQKYRILSHSLRNTEYLPTHSEIQNTYLLTQKYRILTHSLRNTEYLPTHSEIQNTYLLTQKYTILAYSLRNTEYLLTHSEIQNTYLLLSLIHIWRCRRRG